MTNLKPYIPVIIWILIITLLSGYPGHQLPKLSVWQFDKLVHTVMYGILSLLLLIPFKKQFLAKKTRFKTGVFVVLFGVFYGGFMEILQNNIFINRSGNWIDFIANSLGTVLGIIAYPFMIKIVPINRWLKIK